MTFSSIQDKVYRLMRDPGQDAYDLTIVKDYINHAEKRYCAVTGWKVEKSTTITTVADQQEYDLPSDFHAMIGAWRSTERLGIVAQGKTISDPTSGTPTSYYLRQKKLGLYPTPPSSGTTITILYYGVGGSMSADSDEPIIPEEHQMILVFYPCLMCAYESDDEKLGLFRDAMVAELSDANREMIDRFMPNFMQVGEETGQFLDPRKHDVETVL